MRRVVPAVAALFTFAAIFLVQQTPGLAQARTADSVLAAARAALGGDAKIGAVKTFIANGRTRQVRGENLVPIEFEIQAELPDKYSRRDEFPAQDQGPVTAGFVADQLVLIPRPVPPPPRPGAPPVPAGAMEAQFRARMMQAKQDFARLALGMFAGSLPSFPLTFSYVGQAEAPQGKADVLDVKGPANFSGRLFILADTSLPILLSWTAPAGPGRGGPGGPGGPGPGGAPGRGGPGAPAPVTPAPGTPAPGTPAPGTPAPGTPAPGTPAPGTPAPAPPEQRMFFADYRDVDGLKLPFRIRRAVGAETTEETTFDRFRINAKVDPRRFDTTAK
jgi:hypothetical protein